MPKQHFNPHIVPLMRIAEEENGSGYAINLPHKGMIIRVPNSTTQMLYEVKTVEGIKVVIIRYIHYENKKQLLNLLAFACQWWKELKPHMIYMREKKRSNDCSAYMKKLGFSEVRIANHLKPFNCNEDGYGCRCPVYEYTAYRAAR